MRVESRITINRPPDEVFAIATEPGNTPRWSASVAREQPVTEGPTRVGSIRHVEGTIMGQPYAAELELAEYDPPRRAVLQGDAGGTPFSLTFAFAPVADGTSVAVAAEVKLSGAMAMFGGMVARQYRHVWEGDLANLKRMVESGELSVPG